MTPPTAEELAGAQASLARQPHYTLELNLQVREDPHVKRALDQMGRRLALALTTLAVKAIDDPAGHELTRELVTAIFVTGMAYGLEVGDVRVAALEKAAAK